MATNISVITISAPVQKVWNALTKPELVKQWQYGSNLITDWKEGSDIKFITQWKDQVFEQWGKIIEVKPHDIIRYSLFAPRPGFEDKPENYFIMNYLLTVQGGQTKLTIIQEDSRAHAVQEEPKGEENPVLQLLCQIAERN